MELLDVTSGAMGMTQGVTPEEAAALQTAMARLALGDVLPPTPASSASSALPPPPPPPRIPHPQLWGRVNGTAGDYLLVCGLPAGTTQPRRVLLYATSSRPGRLLPLPALLPEHAPLAARMVGRRFLGDPSKVVDPRKPAREEVGKGEGSEEEEEVEEGGEEAEAGDDEDDEEGTDGPAASPKQPKQPVVPAASAAPKPPAAIPFTEAHRLAWAVAGAL